MNENRLEYFIAAAEAGNITKAAERLYISQPALSKHINKLEAETGAKLFDRDSVPLKLTEAGEIYLSYAIETLNRYKNMRADIDLINKTVSKTISFGISLNMSRYFINDVIRIALDIDPEFDFDITEDTSLNMERMLKNGEIDIAFLSTDEIYDKNIEYTVVKEDHIYLVCSKENPALAGRKTAVINGIETYVFSSSETAKLIFYSRDKNYKLTETVNSYLRRKGVFIKNNTVISDINTMLNLVKDTNRFAFFPEFLLDEADIWDKISVYKKAETSSFGFFIYCQYCFVLFKTHSF